MGFDIDELITQMMDGLVKEREEEGSDPKFMLHAKNCAECRDRMMILLEKTIEQAFQQPFFIEGTKEFADRVEEHTKELEAK